MGEPQSAPQRAYTLTLTLGADTARDMAWALRNLAHRVERDEVTQGVWGGPTDGAIYELRINPEQTHDNYVRELNAYLRDTKATGAQTSAGDCSPAGAQG